MKIRTGRKAVVLGVVCMVTLGATAGACNSDDKKSGASQEDKSRTRNQNDLIRKQPAHEVKYSPGRATKNAWIDTWGQEPGKLAYVYLNDGNGKYGYFIFVGPPVTYCDSLVPPYTKTRMDVYSSGQTEAIVPAPGMDGMYHSASNCNILYGVDAIDGKLVEFSLGMNQSYVMFSEPSDLPQYREARQMSTASLEAVKKKYNH